MKNQKELIEQLKANKIKVTNARLDTLKILAAADHPLNVNDIFEKLPGKRKPDLATIYRNIEIFLRYNLILEINLKNQITRYEMADREHHHHFTCKKCRKIVPVQFPELENALNSVAEQLADENQLLEDHSFEFYGKCEQCK